MKKALSESSADTIISDLHRIREEIVDSFGGPATVNGRRAAPSGGVR